eukprot:CAMPEP_0171097604 /NCGR_PEP_ID=MMETSP0766_2-20121228/47645_1 /TAXON_ID=439317 /ORGANISM="Gambierdiscus australes, Strain CAWD 149" /LENGTH=135 /DNA_ID=CAMNT_0011556829 /DNA_START=42 /DNA_END=449 /DNA_ORIENTATION=+
MSAFAEATGAGCMPTTSSCLCSVEDGSHTVESCDQIFRRRVTFGSVVTIETQSTCAPESEQDEDVWSSEPSDEGRNDDEKDRSIELGEEYDGEVGRAPVLHAREPAVQDPADEVVPVQKFTHRRTRSIPVSPWRD